MRIDRVNLYHLRMTLASHFETSFSREFTRDSVLLEVFSEGLVGYGECPADYEPGFSSETVGTAWHILKDFITPPLLGEELGDALDYQNRVAHIRGHRMAKAGFEMAIWDLLGQQAGLSLRDLIGGLRSCVPVGVSVGLQDTPKDLLQQVEGYLTAGYRRVKLKIKPGRDVGDVQAVRENYPDLQLQVDANSAYSLETAEVLRPLDELALLLIEQPLAEDDLWDHSRLQKSFATSLCLDESIRSARHARQALEMEACRVINIKPGRVGGLSQALAIHELCYSQGIPVWCGGMLETGVGRAANLALATLPGFTLPGDISATDRYYAEDITQQRFALNSDSTIDVPQGPGLGISINSAALKKATQTRLSIP